MSNALTPPTGGEVPTSTAEDGIGVLFNVAITCNLCDAPGQYVIAHQIQAKPPATHVVALVVAKCPCIDKRFNQTKD